MNRVIDFHAHFLPQKGVEAARTGKPWFGTSVEKDHRGWPVLVVEGDRRPMGSTAYWDTATERAAKMSDFGVDMQALSVLPALFRYRMDPKDAAAAARDINDEIAATMAELPERYLGLATLPLQDTEASLAEIDRVMAIPGFIGVAVGTHVAGENWNSPRLLPVLEAIHARDAIVFVHPSGHRIKGVMPGFHLNNLIGNPFETTVAVGSLIFGGVLDKVPGIKMIFAHGGGFACANVGRFDHGYTAREDAKEIARQLPSDYLRELYWDCLIHADISLRFLLDVAGESQVVLGTDYPADMGLARPVEWLGSLQLITEDERRSILSGNAARLLDGIFAPA